MRLFDNIMQSGSDTRLFWADAKVVERVAEATPRYVLDHHASRACLNLIRDVPELFEPENTLLRLPAELFWYETHYEADGGSGHGTHMGILVQASADGRSGWAQQFAELPDGSWRAVPIASEFDLDGHPLADRPYAFSLDHDRLGQVRSILRHIVLHADPEYFGRYAPAVRQQAIAEMAESAWFDVPLVLAFAAMLASPGIVESRQSDLARLNRARAKSRKRPLLDHVEVSLVLGAATHGGAGRGGGHRSTPRLHYVRGHVVHRRGRTFWRSPHLRGDTNQALIQRNVRVTAAQQSRAKVRSLPR